MIEGSLIICVVVVVVRIISYKKPAGDGKHLALKPFN